jgi:hypothetical protein
MVIVATNCMAKYILQDEENLSDKKQLHIRGLKYAAQYEARRDLFDKDLFSLHALKSTFISKRSSSPCPAGFTQGSAHSSYFGGTGVFFGAYYNGYYRRYGNLVGGNYAYNGDICVCNLLKDFHSPEVLPPCGASQKCSDGSSGSVAISVGSFSVLACPK